MYLKQQAINTAEHGLVHEVMTHCERSMCPWDIHHFDFVLIILQPSPLYIISAGWLANVHMLLKGLPVKHIHH